MKLSKFLIPFFLLFSFNQNTFAQDCIVIPDALKGKYEGGCDKGKAHGQGKANGSDFYEGEFKNGYPDGRGVYTWKDGHYFIGNYKKGNIDGKGEMYYESATGQDSVISGYWKKNVYVGKYEKPYEVKSMSSRINKVNCRISNKGGQDININVSKISAGLATVNDIAIINGTFYRHNTQAMTNMTLTRIQQVTFPFRAIFTFNTGEITEIIFNENGDYDVEIQLM